MRWLIERLLAPLDTDSSAPDLLKIAALRVGFLLLSFLLCLGVFGLIIACGK